MIEVTEQAHPPGKPNVVVEGDSIDEIVSYMRDRIRPQSLEFYMREMPKCLAKDGEDIVDMHAASGRLHILKLRST